MTSRSARGAARCAPRCRARRPASSPRRTSPERRASPTSITGDVGGTSFDVSLIAGGADGAGGADVDRFRSGRAHADDRDHDHRRRRRIDRLGRSRRAAAGRAGDRRAPCPGPVCYGQGNDAADGDRRQRGARPHQCRPPDRRRARRGSMSRRARRPSSGTSASRSASMRWRRPRRSCASPTPHGRRDPPGLDRARPRSARLRAHAVRRRRRPARRRADARGRAEGGAGPALSRRDLGARLRHRRHAPRFRADASTARSGDRRRSARRRDRAHGRARARGCWIDRASSFDGRDTLVASTCSISARPIPWRRRSPGGRARSTRSDARQRSSDATARSTAGCSTASRPRAQHSRRA